MSGQPSARSSRPAASKSCRAFSNHSWTNRLRGGIVEDLAIQHDASEKRVAKGEPFLEFSGCVDNRIDRIAATDTGHRPVNVFRPFRMGGPGGFDDQKVQVVNPFSPLLRRGAEQDDPARPVPATNRQYQPLHIPRPTR